MKTIFTILGAQSQSRKTRPNQNRPSIILRGCFFVICMGLIGLFTCGHGEAPSFYIDNGVEAPGTIISAFGKKQGTNEAFHLFSHGRSGELLINGKWMDARQIAGFLQPFVNEDIQSVNIYGCEFAKGKKGRQAVTYLETALGIAIAASDNITGKDGDWELEVGNEVNSISPFNYRHNLQCTPGTTIFYENFESIPWSSTPSTTAWDEDGTATTGIWTNIDPTGTTYQKADGHNPGSGNWKYLVTADNSGGVNGADDVDAGWRRVTSPIINVSDEAELSVWYFFGQSDTEDDGGDIFKIDISLDGGATWSTRVFLGDERILPNWTEYKTPIPAGSAVRLRVIAGDGGADGDIIEAGIDDLRITCATVQAPCDALSSGYMDSDGDNVTDLCDLDEDNDGIPNAEEKYCDNPSVANPDHTGSGAFQDGIYIFNWTDADFDDGLHVNDAQTFNLADGLSITATFTQVDIINDPYHSPSARISTSDFQTRPGAGLADLYDISSPNEAALYSNTAVSSAKINVQFTATKNGQPFPIDIIAMDAETTSPNDTDPENNEFLSFETNGMPWAFLEDHPGGAALYDGTGTSRLTIMDSDPTVGAGALNTRSSIFLSRNATEIAISYNSILGRQAFAFGIMLLCDYDNDGVPDYLDTDSDNDGCPDAIEGDANLTYANVQNDTLTGGADAAGIPVVASGGQGVGNSNNAAVNDCLEICDNGIDDDGDGFMDCADSDCPNRIVVFQNIGCLDLDLYDYTSGSEVLNATIQEGDSLVVNTTVGTVWRVRQNNYNNLLQTYTVTTDCQQTVPVKSRDLVIVSNNSSCETVRLFCREVSSNNALYEMADLGPGVVYWLNPSADSAHIYLTDIVTGDTVQGWRTNLNDVYPTCDYTFQYAGSCPEICGNGIDDDGDGSVDSDDPDCFTCSGGLLSNPNFSSGMASWSNWGNTTVLPESNGNTYAHISGGQGGFGQDIAAIPGEIFTLNFFGKNTGTEGSWAGFAFYDASSTKLGGDHFVPITSANFQNYSVTFTAPANTAWVQAYGWKDPGSGTLDLDGYCLTKESPEICDNGIDDDGDGLIDCADPDCDNFLTINTNVPSPSICIGENTTISASASGGSGSYTYTWDNSLGNGISHNISPNATTTYTVTVTSGGGCTSTAQVTVIVNFCSEDCSDGIDNDGDGLIDCDDPDCGLGGSANVADASCGANDGAVTLIATGGSGSYEFSDDNVTWSPNNSFNGLATGNYVFYARNATGECPRNFPFTIDELCEDCTDGIDNDGDGFIDCADSDCAPTANAGSNASICIGSSSTLTASANGGTGPYTYTWDNGLGNGISHNVNPASTTTYTVTVSSATGCTSTAQVTITVTNCAEDCTDGIDNDGDGLIDCDDPDCMAVGAPSLVDDVFYSCPGVTYGNVVSMNDGNLQNPVFSIISNTSNGTLAINNFGAFTYTPFDDACVVDNFTYQVCNQTTGCCATANATINIGDALAPVMLNVPADLTISCDDEIPVPPVILAQDGCPGIYVSLEETDDYTNMGTCGTYTITRRWTATDLCGNSSTDSQTISVVDNVKPELFRLYTLSNGKKMAAGLSQNTSQLWKYVKFPVHFDTLPLVFATLTSNNDVAAATPQVRYVSKTGFEVRLTEEEGGDKMHGAETVSWMAIERGAISGSGQMIADVLPTVNHMDFPLNYALTFPSKPVFMTSPQTTGEEDAFALRTKNETASSITLYLQEEQSKDIETAHANESIAYFAMTSGEDLRDENGLFIGENGLINVNQNWQLVNLENDYSKPVVLIGGVPSGNLEGTNVRVRNVTSTSFEVRLQEWDYLDGSHPNEELGYLVVEGGIPTDPGFFCHGGEENLQPGQHLFAIDNCDGQIAFGVNKTENEIAEGIQTNRSWMAIDDCGNVEMQVRTDTCKVAALYLKTLLSGALIGTSTNSPMRDDLRSKSYLPVEEPYLNMGGFQHRGRGGGEVTSPDVLEFTGTEEAVVDWLFLEIRDVGQPAEVLATQSVLLRKNGGAITAEGQEKIVFYSQPEGDYYVSVRHRNHIGCATGQPFFLSAVNPPLVDFTSPNLELFQTNNASQMRADGRRALWAGDLDGNGRAIYQGPDNDVFDIFTSVLGADENVDFLANFIVKGYERTDLNLDGKTIYQGPGNDRAMLLFNTVLSHPGNTNFLANFIAIGHMP